MSYLENKQRATEEEILNLYCESTKDISFNLTARPQNSLRIGSRIAQLSKIVKAKFGRQEDTNTPYFFGASKEWSIVAEALYKLAIKSHFPNGITEKQEKSLKQLTKESSNTIFKSETGFIEAELAHYLEGVKKGQGETSTRGSIKHKIALEWLEIEAPYYQAIFKLNLCAQLLQELNPYAEVGSENSQGRSLPFTPLKLIPTSSEEVKANLSSLRKKMGILTLLNVELNLEDPLFSLPDQLIREESALRSAIEQFMEYTDKIKNPDLRRFTRQRLLAHFGVFSDSYGNSVLTCFEDKILPTLKRLCDQANELTERLAKLPPLKLLCEWSLPESLSKEDVIDFYTLLCEHEKRINDGITELKNNDYIFVTLFSMTSTDPYPKQSDSKGPYEVLSDKITKLENDMKALTTIDRLLMDPTRCKGFQRIAEGRDTLSLGDVVSFITNQGN
jgi:hypothetical protein